MNDNKSTPNVYWIYSKWFSNPSEYSNAIDTCKNFFNQSMNYISIDDIKDICDIAPCCKSLAYKSAKTKDDKQFIDIEYDCSDLNLLFEIAGEYNHRGREYVLEHYTK